MRSTFSVSLVDAVKRNSKVYLLTGDHGYALFDALRKEKPDHFINAGVAEQNMVGVGAGLSKLGFYPILYGLSAFVPIRVLEQIKLDFCFENLPGLFIGDGAGVVYGHLGSSHQSTEDIAVLKGLPNISILSPCDSHEFKACFEWALCQKSPVYLRIGKADLGIVHQREILQLSGHPIHVEQKSSNSAVFATGSMVKLCQNLITKGLCADLFSVPVIKAKGFVDLAHSIKKYTKIVTVEEHSVYGGLGDEIASIASEIGGIKVKKIGINDKFSQYCGTYDYLLKEHGIDEANLKSEITKWI